jgi:hypothetical protein
LITSLAHGGLTLLEIANEAVDSDNEGDATHPSTEALWDAVLTAGARVYGIASDDAHHYYDADETRARGETAHTGDRGFVMVHATRDAASIRDAIVRGDFYSSNGVLLGRVERTRDALEITVADASRGEHVFEFIGRGGRVLARTRGRSARFALASAGPGYVRARVRGPTGAFAWVQPVFVP